MLMRKEGTLTCSNGRGEPAASGTRVRALLLREEGTLTC